MRSSRILLAALTTLLFTIILFLWGYLQQQRTLGALQQAIKPITAIPSGPAQNPFSYDGGYDDDDIDDGSSGTPCVAVNQQRPGPAQLPNVWRPRVEEFPNGQRIVAPDGKGDGLAIERERRRRKAWAHVQFVNTPQEVCAAVMVLAKMLELGSLGERVLLYPRAWDVELGLVEKRLVGKAAGAVGVAGKAAGGKGTGTTGRKVVQQDGKQQKEDMEELMRASKDWGSGKHNFGAGDWDGEETADRWQKSARRIILSAKRRYGIQLIAIDPLEASVLEAVDRHRDSVPLPAPHHDTTFPEPNTFAHSAASKLLIPHLQAIITPLHLFNLTQFSRIVYFSPNGLILKPPDALIDTLRLPSQPSIVAPRKYWSPNAGEISTEFMIIKPDPAVSLLGWSRMIHASPILSWASTIRTPLSTPSAILAAAGGTSRAIEAVHAASNEVIAHLLHPSSTLVLPAYPYLLASHELHHPASAGTGRRHGSFLGPNRAWNVTEVRERVFYVLFTDGEFVAGMKRPWEAQDGRVVERVEKAIMDQRGGMEEERREEARVWRGWYVRYARYRGEVCLLDLMPSKRKGGGGGGGGGGG